MLSFLQKKTSSSCLLILLGIGALLLGTGCGRNHLSGGKIPGTISHIQDLRLGLPEAVFHKADDIFVENILPDKVRKDILYTSRENDEHGGTYCARFIDGECLDVIVDYSKSPVSRQLATKVMNNLFPADRGALTEHDQSELKLTGLSGPTEYFYFGPRYGAEIGYTVSAKEKKALFIHAWLDSDVLDDRLAQTTD